MKQFPLYVASALTLLASVTACDNSSSLDMPGSAIVSDRFEVVVADTFKLYARSILNPRVQSRTTTQLLGAIEAPTYGTLRADYVAQFFPSNAIDTVGVTLDSVKVQLVFERGGFVGDSLAPIGFEVYPLVGALPYPIYSDFPAGTSYETTPFYKASDFTPDDCRGSGMFTASGAAISDVSGGSDYRFAYATVPLEFGRKIFDAYRNPSTRYLFSSPEEFASELFPGIYVKTTFGSGRVTRITDTRLIAYYTKREKLANADGVLVDSIRHLYNYYMTTAPEVVSNTNIDLTLAKSVTDMAEEEGRAVIVSPAGRDVEMAFPIANVIEAYDEASERTLSVINTLTFSVPCDSVENGRGIKPADYLLMVLSKDKDKFFAANKLPDDVTSFVAKYNANTMTYDFGNLRDYVMEMRAKGDALTPADYTFTITPVTMVYESNNSYYTTSSTLSGLSPMVGMPSMTELLPEKAKITLTFSRRNPQ